MRRVHVNIRGRVQGVYFRAGCQEQGKALGLAGWVRNRTDGSVELVAEGDPEAIDALLLWCRKGPDLARVDALDVIDQEPAGLQGFQIRPTSAVG